ncbi:MAG TPA: HAD-IA family hydrolase [Acidimicrobiales bacterium]|nr:HAD-IA family hydrolase [Acidimicrobiales bacterium]
MHPRSTTPPTAVLFDFGGVITTSPFEAFARYEASHGLPDGFIRSINATDPDTNAWARLERNEVDVDAFAPLFEAEAAALGQLVDAHEVLACLSGEIRPSMVIALERLSGHVALGLLTNNFVSVEGEGPPSMTRVLELFDVVIESSTAGCRKPDPRFYELALEGLGIDAEEAVFLDDLGVNLKPARAMGMATIKVADPEQALDELEALVDISLR